MQQKKGRADQQEIFDFIDDYTAAKEYQLKKKDRNGRNEDLKQPRNEQEHPLVSRCVEQQTL